MVATAEITGSPVEDLVVRIDRGTGASGYMVLVAQDGGTLKALPIDIFVVGGGAAVAQF